MTLARAYAYVPCAPRSPVVYGHRGLHKVIAEHRSHGELRRRLVDAAGAPPGVGVCYSHPWGKALLPFRCADGQWTRMTSLALRACQADPAHHWVVESFELELERVGRPVMVYAGGNPAVSLEHTGLDDYLDDGHALALDAVAGQGETSMVDSVAARHARGLHVLVEANRRRPDRLPCLARWPLWGLAGRYSRHDAPAGSCDWFPSGVNSAEEWKALELDLELGLVPVVNAGPTTNRSRLWAVLRGAGL